MTKEQQVWVDKIKKQLQEEIERRWPLTDNDWEQITVTIDEIMKKANGNPEVRSALFDLIEVYDRKAREERKHEQCIKS